MRLVVLASGAFAVPTVRWMVGSGHQLALLMTQPARGSGRGRRLTPTPVAQLAEELGLSCVEAEDVNDPVTVDRVRDAAGELCLVIAFGQKLGRAFRDLFAHRCVNLHASLLPKYRGAAPIQWAVVHGEERTGCTVFHIEERMDAGPILTSRWTWIKPEETAGELHDRLAAIGVDAVQETLTLFDGGRVPDGAPQDDSLATRAPKLSKSDGVVHFDRPVESVVRHVLGMTPWPGAAARYESTDGRWERVTLARIRRAECPAAPRPFPGTLNDCLYVSAQDAFLEVLEIRPSSGRLMTWKEFCNGRRVKPGDRLACTEN